jgi:hypothetical protein
LGLDREVEGRAEAMRDRLVQLGAESGDVGFFSKEE